MKPTQFLIKNFLDEKAYVHEGERGTSQGAGTPPTLWPWLSGSPIAAQHVRWAGPGSLHGSHHPGATRRMALLCLRAAPAFPQTFCPRMMEEGSLQPLSSTLLPLGRVSSMPYVGAHPAQAGPLPLPASPEWPFPGCFSSKLNLVFSPSYQLMLSCSPSSRTPRGSH